jgi:putative DNA primase/helicase
MIADIEVLLPARLRQRLTEPTDDRSTAVFGIVSELAKLGHACPEIVALLSAHPEGPASRFRCAEDLDRDVCRILSKIGDHVFESLQRETPTASATTTANENGDADLNPTARSDSPVSGSNNAPAIDPSAPLDTARAILRHEVQTGSPLRCHRGSFYRFDGAAYCESGEADIRAGLYKFMARSVKRDAENGRFDRVKPNTRMINDLLDALRAAAIIPSGIESPAWLGEPDQPAAHEILSCENGLLHLPSATLLPHNPNFFTLNAVGFAYDPAASPPSRWLDFLEQLWPDDIEAIEALQELFGYCLTGDTRQQKIFLIIGPPRSGKGTIVRVLRELVGPNNTVAPTLAGLGMNFGLAALIGKRVSIVSDARLGGRVDQHIIVERLLSISGEDALTIDRKYRDPWTGRLQTRFVILSNELPRLADASGALVSRIILLVLSTSFLGREDPGLTDRLLTELPGILNWAIAGWGRLISRGHFRQPRSALEAIQQLNDLTSPINAFLRDRCLTGAEYSIEVARLFECWCEWCGVNRRDRPGTAQTFGRDLRAVLPGLKIVQPRDGPDRSRHYQGIGLR